MIIAHRHDPRLLLLLIMGFLELAGNSSSDITFNFWIDAFPQNLADFTILYLSAVFYFILVVPATLLWFWVRRNDCGPQYLISKNKRAVNIALLAVTALCDVCIDVFGTYAAGHVPVAMQLVLKSAEPIVCWLLTSLLWRRKHARWLDFLFPMAAFGACGAGLTAEMWISLQHSEEKTNQGFWIGVFALRVTCSAGYNVAQAKFIRDNAEAFNDEKDCGDGSLVATASERKRRFTQRLLLNFVSLAGDFSISLCFYTLLGPSIDTIRLYGWGSSATVGEAWSNFGDGVRCVGWCSNNLAYALATNIAWCLVYVADTFLNELCPALNSIVNMLSGPIATLAIIAVPSWSLGEVNSSAANVAAQLAAIACLIVGLLLFAIYERRAAKLEEMPRLALLETLN
jgi:hypothetical protein